MKQLDVAAPKCKLEAGIRLPVLRWHLCKQNVMTHAALHLSKAAIQACVETMCTALAVVQAPMMWSVVDMLLASSLTTAEYRLRLLDQHVASRARIIAQDCQW